jgi:hypothetical protein
MTVVVYLLKARTVEAEKQLLLGNGLYTAEERVMYALNSHNSRRGVASDVLCGSVPQSLLCNCAVNISLQQ